ncbi:YybH family protein [Larkinella rosea]|uniref:DUF4440 domain-containing protein n=1 Tax=Larkinella rosea TaxID=2025312 RepID=A0A3P1BTP6_9BACT|nr:nuclear transport factor 2 family protein [Larkinella rosea]RRB04392.1 DUF4440 domain-containing protein [Larkinella rosea]
MKSTIHFPLLAAFVLILSASLVGCQEKAATETATTKPDLAQARTEVENIEKEWATALNRKDLDKLMSLYADDAVSYANDFAMLKGKEAIRKKQAADFASDTSKLVYSFETMDVFSEGNQVLETGKTIRKDASGKTILTGKYMAFFEKRDGKLLCIREMYNNDAKAK